REDSLLVQNRFDVGRNGRHDLLTPLLSDSGRARSRETPAPGLRAGHDFGAYVFALCTRNRRARQARAARRAPNALLPPARRAACSSPFTLSLFNCIVA